MTGTCIEKLSHQCTPTRKSKDGLQVWANENGTITGFCFSCGTFIPNPYGTPRTSDDVNLPKPKTEAEIQADVEEIKNYPTVDLVKRRLRADSLEKFGVKVALSEEDGVTPTAYYFPFTKDGVLSGYYAKSIDGKHRWAIGNFKDAQPYNWDMASKNSAYRLVITEGPEDMVAVDRIYEMHGEAEWHPQVISIPWGAKGAKKSLAPYVGQINKLFKEVILCFDNDEPGQKAVEEVLSILPMAKTALLPCKDANECLISGVAKQAYRALRNSSVPKNTRLIMGENLHELAREPTPMGELTWPYPTMQKLLRGIRYGETIYLGSGVKMGKSEWLNDMATHFMKKHGIKVLVVKPEEDNKKTYKLMANKAVGKVFHDPNVEFDYKAFDEAGKVMHGKLVMLDLYQHLGWESLKIDITQAAAMGCRAVFIDPITNLINGIESGEANTKLQEIAQQLAVMAKDLQIVIFIFCHLKAPEGNISKDVRQKKYEKGQFIGLGNAPHEFGGDILSAQFSGSRAMMRSCNLMLGLEGNKDPDLDETVRASRWLTILEDREFGNSGKVRLFWDKKTTLYREI